MLRTRRRQAATTDNPKFESFPLRELLKNKAVVRTSDCTRISRRLNVELIQTLQIGNFVLWRKLCFTF